MMTLRLLLVVLVAAPAQAAQIAPRVFRAPAPIRVTPGMTPLAPRLTATPTLGAPALQAALPVIAPAVAVAPVPAVAVAASAQLSQAVELAAPSQAPSEQQGASWSSWWSGSERPRSEASSVAAAPSQTSPSRLKKAEGKKTKLMGGIGAGAAAALESVRMGLDAVAPLTQVVGQAWTAQLASGPLTRSIGKLGANLGWSPAVVTALQRVATVALYAAALTAPLTMPAAAWAVAAPYASALGITWAVKKLDAVVEKQFGASPKVALALKTVLWLAGGALTLEAAGFAVDALVMGAWQAVAPYTTTAGALTGTFVVHRAVRWGIDKIAQKAGWEPNTKVVVKMVASIVTWTSGVALGLSAAGVSSKGLMATFGIGGIAVTMAARDFIGNFMEAAKLLLLRPFLVGDRVKIGDVEYTVKGLSLRYLELEKQSGTTTFMPFSQVAGKSLTVYREYELKHRHFAGGVKPVGLKDFWRAARELGRPVPQIHMGKAALLAVLGLAVIFGMPVVAAKSTMPWLITALPYLKAGGALWATRWASTWLSGLVARVAQVAGWDQQAAAVVKFLAQAGAWVLGGTITLAIAGVTWSALLAGMGASSIAIGWASSDIIGNLIQGMWILASQPFKIGDEVEIGTLKGRIVDMNVNFVVLEHDVELNGQAVRSHTLVPYSVVKGSAFTVPTPSR